VSDDEWIDDGRRNARDDKDDEDDDDEDENARRISRGRMNFSKAKYFSIIVAHPIYFLRN